MPDRTFTARNGDEESADAIRERRSAEEVAEWEAAFHAPRAAPGDVSTADRDSANAGAMVSRAHRAEKNSGHSHNE